MAKLIVETNGDDVKIDIDHMKVVDILYVIAILFEEIKDDVIDIDEAFDTIKEYLNANDEEKMLNQGVNIWKKKDMY